MYCIIGSRYMTNVNQDASKDVANGTIAILKDVVLKPDTQIRILNFKGGSQVHAVFANEVNCLIFDFRVFKLERSASI